MEGDGAHNRSSRVQAAGLLPAVSLLEQAARAAPLAPAPEAVVIADYGASEGRNSLLPMARAIGALRGRVGPERAINIVHTDLPDNDFSALFETLANDPESYLKHDPNAFAYAVGRSYFEQLMPSLSVTLGWSSWAIQWLSRVPAMIPDQVQVAYSRDADVREAFARQAAEDWRRFLLMRSRELKKGGRLVVLTMALDAEGRFGYAPVLDALYATLREMVADGFLKPGELSRMAIPTVGRNKEDLAAPFAEDGRFAGLAIEDLEVFMGEDRIWAAFETSGDAEGFGAEWARFSRASVFPSLASALDKGADTGWTAKFFDRLETDLAVRLAKAPAEMKIPLAKMLLVKGDAALAY
jgi:SAM dependent carboxyl methyltransferase